MREQRNCQCLQVFNCSFLNVGWSSWDCAPPDPQRLLLTRALLFWVHIPVPEATVVCVAVRFLIQQLLPSQKCPRLPVYDSIKFLFLAFQTEKKKPQKKSHCNLVLWHSACAQRTAWTWQTGNVFCSYSPLAPPPPFFCLSVTFLETSFSLSLLLFMHFFVTHTTCYISLQHFCFKPI